MGGELWVSGPLIEVRIGSPAAGGATETLEAIIDTGASVICMDARVPKRLGLTPVNRKPMQMADGSSVEATSYMGRLRISGLGFDELVEVYGVPMQYPSQRVLLGRSFLRGYIVSYNGREELFHFYRDGGSALHEDQDG